jgi:hypothetical protein
MPEKLLEYGLQYGIYMLEALVFAVVVHRGQWRRYLGVSVYLLSFAAVDLAVRPYFLYHYGLDSLAYAYCYWLTDALLALEAFGLMCIFFRRACPPKLWDVLRLALPLAFILVAAISCRSLSIHKNTLLHDFIYEFEQILFFTCLVLNTLLYVMLTQTESADSELGLLVCGMGILFAGPSAALALVHVTFAGSFSVWLLAHVMPLCTLGMLLVWLYAITATHKEATRTLPKRGPRVPALAEAGS